MTARQPPEEPTRRFPPARPIATEREVVRPAPEEMLWAEALDRLGSVRAGLAVVAVLALAALGLALWAVLDDPSGPDREGASPVRVERLADRVDRLESQVGETASQNGVAAIRTGQQALQRRVQTLEATVQEFEAASQDAGEIAAEVEGLNDSMQALEQRIQALEQQQP